MIPGELLSVAELLAHGQYEEFVKRFWPFDPDCLRGGNWDKEPDYRIRDGARYFKIIDNFGREIPR